jgi:hypothetical protein
VLEPRIEAKRRLKKEIGGKKEEANVIKETENDAKI